MDANTIPILCDPYTHEPLKHVIEEQAKGKRSEMLVNVRSGKKYHIKEGIPVFIEDPDVTGLNKKYQCLYNRFGLAFLYDVGSVIGSRVILHASDMDSRKGYLKDILGEDNLLKIDDNTKILEVSIGTGRNIMAFPKKGRYYGLDISWGMLTRCQKNMKKDNRKVELFLGNAEYLPFVENCFDIVFHVGGINFFNDKARAINEMIRVAKPGTRIAIVDETEKIVKEMSNIPVASSFYKDMEKETPAPVELVPKSMRDIKVDYIRNGKLYALQFIKP